MYERQIYWTMFQQPRKSSATRLKIQYNMVQRVKWARSKNLHKLFLFLRRNLWTPWDSDSSFRVPYVFAEGY